MRTTLVLIGLLIGLWATAQTAPPPAKAPQTQWLNYSDSASRLNVWYPATWRLKTTNPKSPIVLHAPSDGEDDTFSENINYVVRELPKGQPVALTDVATAVRSGLSNVVDDFTLEYEKNGKWLGVASVEFAYTGTSKGDNGGVKVRIVQRIALVGGKMILATYTAEGGKTDPRRAQALNIIDRTALGNKRVPPGFN
jgi:hypothetical protein